jgi:hypothetical protein
LLLLLLLLLLHCSRQQLQTLQQSWLYCLCCWYAAERTAWAQPLD